MILVDTSVLIDYFNDRKIWQVEKLEKLFGSELLITGDIILLELLQGINRENDYELVRNEMSIFPCYNLCDKNLALKSAANFRFLRKRGISIRKTIDVIIATFCIENNIRLLHNDKDFYPFEKYLDLNCVYE